MCARLAKAWAAASVETRILSTATAPQLAETAEAAAALLARGGAVALPTETVYGLAADALNPVAALKIFEAKERPHFDPLIVHLPDRGWLERIAAIPPQSRAIVDALIEKFWPGPLTLVLPRRETVPDVVAAGLATVAVRLSAHPVFRAVIERCGRPLAAPSANRFGRISPTAATHVFAELNGRIPMIVDGGATTHGIESTILAVGDAGLRLLRAGPITPEEIEAVWRGVPGRQNATAVAAAENETRSLFPKPDAGAPAARIEAPGQLQSHYAPRTPMRLLAPGSCADVSGAMRAGCLAWKSAPEEGCFCETEILSRTGDLREAAATLFAKMRRLDDANLDVIFAEAVPEQGLGWAIMDRLRRAAAR